MNKEVIVFAYAIPQPQRKTSLRQTGRPFRWTALPRRFPRRRCRRCPFGRLPAASPCHRCPEMPGHQSEEPLAASSPRGALRLHMNPPARRQGWPKETANNSWSLPPESGFRSAQTTQARPGDPPCTDGRCCTWSAVISQKCAKPCPFPATSPRSRPHHVSAIVTPALPGPNMGTAAM